MNILVTNDDGVHAPGLLALATEMRKFGRVLVLGPDRNWSGRGHVKTLDRPLRVTDVELADGTTAQASDGAPSDCVALAVLGYYETRIDLVVSGINPMPNLGHDVTYSGTVTAAMEAVIWGIPGFAFSLGSDSAHPHDPDYSAAARIAGEIVGEMLAKGIPENTLLNVNIPYMPYEDIRGKVLTRQGLRVYRDRLDHRTDPRGKDYYWIGGDAPTGVPEPGTDVGAIAAGLVSITPLQLDLTARDVVKSLPFPAWKGAVEPDSPHQSMLIHP